MFESAFALEDSLERLPARSPAGLVLTKAELVQRRADADNDAARERVLRVGRVEHVGLREVGVRLGGGLQGGVDVRGSEDGSIRRSGKASHGGVGSLGSVPV